MYENAEIFGLLSEWLTWILFFGGGATLLYGCAVFALAGNAPEGNFHDVRNYGVALMLGGVLLIALAVFSKVSSGRADQYTSDIDSIAEYTAYDNNIITYYYPQTSSVISILTTVGVILLTLLLLAGVGYGIYRVCKFLKKRIKTAGEAKLAMGCGAIQHEADMTQKIEATKEAIRLSSVIHGLHWSEDIKDTLDKLANYSVSGRPITVKLSGDIEFLLQEFHSITETHKTFTNFATPELYKEATDKLKERMSLLEGSLKQVLDSLLSQEMMNLRVDTNLMSQHYKQNTQKESPFVQQ